MSTRLATLFLLLALAGAAVSSGCSKRNEEKPRPEIPKGGLKDIAPKSGDASKFQTPP